MGRSVSNVTFRVFVVQIGPLEESAVWVDESRTVPAREAIRNIPESTESVDALGLRVEPQKKMDQASLMQMFPEGSGNRRMENFNPAWYLLENHRGTSLEDLRKGLANLTRNAREEEKSSADKNTRGWPLTKNIHEEGEYSTILNDYTRAKSLFKDTEVPLFREVMHELDSKMEVFKKNMKQRLIDMPTSFEDQSKLIKYLKVYSSSATNINYVDRQHDICQMLINTINVSSWLMLNALVPSSVPESVVSQYKEQFVEWPEISSTTLTNQLFASLKII
uniref:Exocyst complex component 2 n=1 Tax=Parascaris equorum TaxID=6256 RepID=A0A914RSG7_PAREQ